MNTVCVPEEVYFGLYKKIGRLSEENRYLKHLNENQLNMILDLRKEIADLKKQKEGLCELIGKTKKDCEKLCAEYSALLSTNTQYVNEIRKLKKQLESPCKYCNVFDSRLDDAEAALKDADDKINELKRNHEVAMNNQRETYRAELKKREEDIREYRKDNCRLRKELDDARYLYGALIKELARVGGEEQCSSSHV